MSQKLILTSPLLVKLKTGSGEIAYKSIAVLPFLNLSDDKSNEYFADDLAEEILNLLARVPDLKVTARTSAFTFRGQDLDIPTIAKKLSVANVLEGSVRRSNGRLRITAQLIEAETGFHLWGRLKWLLSLFRKGWSLTP